VHEIWESDLRDHHDCNILRCDDFSSSLEETATFILKVEKKILLLILLTILSLPSQNNFDVSMKIRDVAVVPFVLTQKLSRNHYFLICKYDVWPIKFHWNDKFWRKWCESILN
jgi:hypothetical protein